MYPQTHHILLADDDPDDVLLTREALKELGINDELTSVGDGRELLDYLAARSDNPETLPDLILLDLNMPRMDGLEALTALKANPDLAGIPVVVLSTSNAKDDINTVYQLGGNAYVTKASTFTDILSLLGALTHFWFDTVQLPDRSRR